MGEVREVETMAVWDEEGGVKMGGGLCEEVRSGRFCERAWSADGVLEQDDEGEGGGAWR